MLLKNAMRPAAVVLFCLAAALPAQQVSSSSGRTEGPEKSSSVVPRHGVEAGGSGVSLETSEALFEVAAGLNACGYDNGLENSLPVRAEIRREMSAAVAASPEAELSRLAMCRYTQDHNLNGAQNLAQYVSLALFLTPPPALELSVSESEMPPDSLQVAQYLPLLRDFAQKVQLHNIYVRHRAQYEAAVEQVHDALTRMLLETNLYLHQPVSSYDGRRFLVLLEPMLSPQAVNSRIYGDDYFLAVSPSPAEASTNTASAGTRLSTGMHASGLQMAQIRHVYLSYNIDPIIYARAGSTNRLLPLLKTVSEAPIDYHYKSDIVALTAECLIKAIEARTMDVGFPKPSRPSANKQRSEIDGYNEAVVAYDKRAEAVRRRQVALDMASGWVLTKTFYEKLALTDREGISLQESIGEIVYGMDVSREVDQAKHIPFLEPNSPELVAGGGISRSRAPRVVLTPMDQAELKKDPSSGAALYMLARLKLMQGDPEGAFERLSKVVATSKDPRTLAWSHIYLGRLYDSQQQPNRTKAVAEYRAALNIPGVQPDVQAAAAAGMQKPFAAPKRDAAPAPADDEELDPTGRKQKESYRPGEAIPPPAR